MRYPIVALFALVPALPVAGALGAQEASDTARVTPVIVTATHTPLHPDQVPASASVITGAELRAQGIVHLADAMRALPGVVVARSGSWGAPASLFVRGGQSNYTKVLIDGVPVNEPGGAFDFGTLTLDDVERIEIVRGPSSVVWGSDAVSAVVHVITRRGAANRATLTARGGTYGTADASGSIERTAGPWRGAVTGAHHTSDGSYDMNSAYRNSVASGSGGWLGGAASLRLNGRYASTRAHFPTDFTGAPVDPNSHRIEERASASLEAGYAIGPATARLIGTHSLVSASSVNPADVEPGTSDSYDTRTRRQQVELRAELPLVANVLATVGGVAEGQHRVGASNYVTTSAGAPPATSRTEQRASRQNRAGFVELLATGAATTLSAGARADRSDTYGTFGTYRVGLSHRLPTATRVRAALGTAFREPSFDEALPSPFSAGNPDIRPERTTSWEVGAEQAFADARITLGATYFWQRFSNLIDYFADEFPGRYENVAVAHARGVEVEAKVRPAPAWTVDASATLLRTRVESAGFGSSLADGRELLRRPRRTGAAAVTYAAAGASLGARVTYVGERQDVRFTHGPPFSAEERLPAYTKLDLSAERPVLGRGARALVATLRVDNVLGERFEPAAGYAAPGRVVLAGLRAGF